MILLPIPSHLSAMAGAPLRNGSTAIGSPPWKVPSGAARRGAASGTGSTRLVPVEFLVPECAKRWRPLVQDAMQFVFSQPFRRRAWPQDRRTVRASAGGARPSAGSLQPHLQNARASESSGRCWRAIGGLDASLRTPSPNSKTACPTYEFPMNSRHHRRSPWPPVWNTMPSRSPRQSSPKRSVSAVIRFTWQNPNRERQRAVFKVLKPYVPDCFAEDMTLLQRLGEFLASVERGYRLRHPRHRGDAGRGPPSCSARELDFAREQATLAEAGRAYPLQHRYPRAPRHPGPLHGRDYRHERGDRRQGHRRRAALSDPAYSHCRAVDRSPDRGSRSSPARMPSVFHADPARRKPALR